MNLQELRAAGAFVEPEALQHAVEWTHRNAQGVEVTDRFDVWVRRRSFGMVERILSGNGDRSRSAEMLSQCLLIGEDQEALSYEDAYQLDPGLAFVLVNAVKDATAPKA